MNFLMVDVSPENNDILRIKGCQNTFFDLAC